MHAYASVTHSNVPICLHAPQWCIRTPIHNKRFRREVEKAKEYTNITKCTVFWVASQLRIQPRQAIRAKTNRGLKNYHMVCIESFEVKFHTPSWKKLPSAYRRSWRSTSSGLLHGLSANILWCSWLPTAGRPFTLKIYSAQEGTMGRAI